MADRPTHTASPIVANAFSSFPGKGGKDVRGEAWDLKVRVISKESRWQDTGVTVHTCTWKGSMKGKLTLSGRIYNIIYNWIFQLQTSFLDRKASSWFKRSQSTKYLVASNLWCFLGNKECVQWMLFHALNMISVVRQVTLKLLQKDVGLLRVKNCIQNIPLICLRHFTGKHSEWGMQWKKAW